MVKVARGDEVRGCPKSASKVLLSDLPSHWTMTNGTDIDEPPSERPLKISASTLAIYFPSHKNRPVTTLIIFFS